MYSQLLLAASLVALAQGSVVERHVYANRQAPASPSPPPAPGQPSASAPGAPPPPPPPGAPSAAAPTPSPGAPSAPGAPAVSAPPGAPVPSAAVSQSFQFTSGGPTMTVSTHAPGETPPIAGAPPLPSAFVYQAASWPKGDTLPDTTSPEVQSWMKELDGHNIPNIAPTKDGSCAGDAAAAADAANRGWWTCGGYTRATDIVACPDKQTWGVSFDDGPGVYTPTLLQYLDQKQISATFFVVGSRVVERPAILIEEYMKGHEISVHTWSHSKPLTSLTNEQIVAELGWTRKAIKQVLGVTPTTMRPPWGDIDDRVRAISMAMGLIPIMWTRTPGGVAFDTNDWQVAGGLVTADQSLQTFSNILGNATQLNTGFIVLEHDIHEVTVQMAIRETLNRAQTHNPPFKLEKIGQCMHYPNTDMYRETTTNTTFPYRTTQSGQATAGADIDGDSKVDQGTAGKASNGAMSISSISTTLVFGLVMAVAGMLGLP